MPRLRAFGVAISAVVVALATLTPSVSADRLFWDHQPFTNCVGTTQTKTILWSLGRSNLGAKFKNGQVVKFGVLAVQQPQNGTMTAKLKDNSIRLPANWKSRPLNSVSADTITLKVTFTATLQGEDGGRIRLVANGRLESIDVPTMVSCTSASANDARPATATESAAEKEAELLASAKTELTAATSVSATDDYYYALDPGLQGPGGFTMDVLLNDRAPNPANLEILSNTQLKAPTSMSDTGTLSQLGNITISGDGKSLHWTDDRCNAPPYNLCANLPGLFFDYTASDGATTSKGRAWIKFDRPWLLPLDYDPDVFLVPPETVNALPVGETLPILEVTPSSFSNMPALSITVAGKCPVVDPPKVCVADTTVITTGTGIPPQLTTKSVLAVGQPIEVTAGEAFHAPGEIAFPSQSQVGPGQAVCYQYYPEDPDDPTGPQLVVPMLCAADLPGTTSSIGKGSALQSWSVYIGNWGTWETASDSHARRFCLDQAGTNGPEHTRSHFWELYCKDYLTDGEWDTRWG